MAIDRIFNRIFQSSIVLFLKYLFGARKPYSSLSSGERKLLSDIAKNARYIIEVGVFEGVTSKLFCEAMKNDGTIFLIDPYFLNTFFERLLKFYLALTTQDFKLS